MDKVTFPNDGNEDQALGCGACADGCPGKQCQVEADSPPIAAAPQVVADERAAFEKEYEGTLQLEQAGNTDSFVYAFGPTQFAWDVWQARAALAAASVQPDTGRDAALVSDDLRVICDGLALFEADTSSLQDHARCERLQEYFGNYPSTTHPAPEVASVPSAGGKPIGEVAASGRFTSDCEWYSGYMPPVGTKLYAAPVQPVAVPDGWRMVPIVPTPKMVNSTFGDDMSGLSHNRRNKDIWAAMIASCPAAPAAQGDAIRKVEVDDQGPLGVVTKTTYALANAKDAKDAERYRWLRRGDNDEIVLQRGPVDPAYVYLPRNEKLDAMIDAAIAAKAAS